jgi:molybdate transport system regulatory protein
MGQTAITASSRAMAVSKTPFLRIWLAFPDGFALGPGKADLLAGVERSGSISAACREMGMSYKKAWQMVDEMNHAFREPLVDAAKGGAAGGGAQLTDTGRKVLALYRTMQDESGTVAAGPLAEMAALAGKGKQKAAG